MIPNLTNILPIIGELENRLVDMPKSAPLPGPAVRAKKDSYQVDPDIIKKSPWINKLNCVRDNRAILHDPASADLEFFVKRTINNPLNIGHQVKMRRLDGGQDTYTVYRKIAKGGLVSYALKPDRKGLPPLIVFRCTEPDLSKEASLESIQNDLNSRIGERGWRATKRQFEALMNDRSFRMNGERVCVAGYSLGGLHANIFAGNFHQDIDHVISYSAPSMNRDLAEKFAKEINRTKREKPLIIQIHRTRGDPCHLAGEKQLGWGIDSQYAKVQLLESIVLKDQGLNIGHHRKLVFVPENDFTVIEITEPKKLLNELDNLSSHRGPYIEILRSAIGPTLSKALNIIERISKILKPFTRDQSSPSSHYPMKKRITLSK